MLYWLRKIVFQTWNYFWPLIKAEQHAHEQTKINAQAELDRYREQLEQEKDMTVKGVIDEYMKLNLGKVNIYYLIVLSSVVDGVFQNLVKVKNKI